MTDLADTEATVAPVSPHDPDEWHPTACILCENNCGIEVKVSEAGRFTRIRGDKAHPESKGYTCEKALRLDHYQNGRHRLTTPMKRMPDGTHQPIDWDTAITEIALQLRTIRDTHGGESIFYYGGGGQGNHLNPPHGIALHRAFGGRFRSGALAQEKTGEFWIDGQMVGGHTVGDFHHTEVAIFIGKNPWQSHGIPEARRVLKAIAADENRSMVVIDPRVSETAALADHHLRVKPGTDAWCLLALLGTIVQEGLVDAEFVRNHVVGADQPMARLAVVPVAQYAAICGIDEDKIRSAARRIATASSACVYEDLGIQMGVNSTLCSYVNKLLWVLTGNFAKEGGQNRHTHLVDITGGGRQSGVSPVTGERIIAGLVPCNVIPDEILTDHPDRFHAMIVESSNPVSSLADTARWIEALEALDTVIVIDVAMTETARHADYVLPAASQYEKWEATFFTGEFPENVFQLRRPLLPPAEGTLPEAEIHARILKAAELIPEQTLEQLRHAASAGRAEFAAAFFDAAAANPTVGAAAQIVLYETLGPTLENGAQPAALLWAIAHRIAPKFGPAINRAGIEGEGLELGESLFEALQDSERGIIFSRDEYDHVWDYVNTPDRKVHVDIPEMLALLDALPPSGPSITTSEFPFVLAAGERRSFTANAIMRDPDWRKKDPGGALRISPADASDLGLDNDSRVKIITSSGEAVSTVEITEMMQRGHISIPNGLGLDYPDQTGEHMIIGVAPNRLTDSNHRDEFAGTPFHKHVAARLEKI
ncbi:MAG: molybdopterin-dependent oxidoreductase [Acidimicrobiales bacterium]